MRAPSGLTTSQFAFAPVPGMFTQRLATTGAGSPFHWSLTVPAALFFFYTTDLRKWPKAETSPWNWFWASPWHTKLATC